MNIFLWLSIKILRHSLGFPEILDFSPILKSCIFKNTCRNKKVGYVLKNRDRDLLISAYYTTIFNVYRTRRRPNIRENFGNFKKSTSDHLQHQGSFFQWFTTGTTGTIPVVLGVLSHFQWFLTPVVCFFSSGFLAGRRPAPLQIPVVIGRPKADVLLIPVV